MDKFDKIFLETDKQIELLKSRGLIIVNEKKLKTYLLFYNYENIINGYNDFFMTDFNRNSNSYWKNTTEEHILALFNFDRSISLIFLSEILNIERSLSTLIAYHLVKYAVSKNIDKAQYGTILNWNLDDFMFVFNKLNVNEFSSFREKLIENCHHKKHLIAYENNKFISLPVWKMVIYFNFKTSIKVFSSLHIDIKSNILQSLFKNKIKPIYDVTLFREKEFIDNFVETLVAINNIRNIICHNNVLYKIDYNNNINNLDGFLQSFSFIENINATNKKINKLRLGEFIKILKIFNANSKLNSLIENKFDVYLVNNSYLSSKIDEEIIKKIFAYMHL